MILLAWYYFGYYLCSMLPDGYYITKDGTVHSRERTITYTNKHGDAVQYTKPAQVIKPFKTNSGYLFVSITSQHRKFYIHRLLAHYFIGVFTKEKNQVNHINGIKTDNRLENLEIVSHSQNLMHNYRALGLRSKSAILTNEQAAEIRTLVRGGKTQKECSTLFGVSKMVVSRIINNVQQAYKI